MRALRIVCLGILVAAAGGAHAQSSAGSYVIECPKNAPNMNLLRSALRTRVLESIDTTQYTEVSVGIGLRRVSVDTAPQTVSGSSVIGDITLQNGTPTGLGFTASGMTDFSIECEWSYKLRINTRGRALSNNQIVRAVTDSDVKIRRKVIGTWRRQMSNP